MRTLPSCPWPLSSARSTPLEPRTGGGGGGAGGGGALLQQQATQNPKRGRCLVRLSKRFSHLDRVDRWRGLQSKAERLTTRGLGPGFDHPWSSARNATRAFLYSLSPPSPPPPPTHGHAGGFQSKPLVLWARVCKEALALSRRLSSSPIFWGTLNYRRGPAAAPP